MEKRGSCQAKLRRILHRARACAPNPWILILLATALPVSYSTERAVNKKHLVLPMHSASVASIGSTLDVLTHLHLLIGEAHVAPASQMRFLQQPFLDRYRFEIAAAASLLVLETLLIAGLLVNRARWARAEKENKRLALWAQQEHRRLEEVLSNVPGVVWEMRSAGDSSIRRLVFVSDYVETMIGYSAEELLAKPLFWVSIIDREDREKVLAAIEASFASGRSLVIQFRVTAKDGRTVWSEAHLAPVIDETGSLAGVRGVSLDITERKLGEDALRQSEEKTTGILRAIPDLMFLLSPEGVYLDCHAGDQNNLLVPSSEFLGKNHREVLPPELADTFGRLFQRARMTGETQIHEYPLFLRGEERWFEARIVGSGANILSIVRDITDSKRAEEAVRQSEANYRSIFNAVNDAIFVHDVESGEVVDVNQVMCDMYGVSAEEARAIGIAAVSSDEPPYTAEEAFARLKKAAEGEPQIFEWRAKDKEGRLFWVEVSLSRSLIGGRDRILAVVRDITYRREAADAMRQSEQRFRTMADTAPVMIWIAGTDKLCTYFNQQWLDFTGRTIEQEIGNGWTDGVYSDDLDRCLATYSAAFELRESFRMEYRLRRADGEFRWVLDSGSPQFAPNGELLGYIGSCIDITDRKTLEESLADLSGELIRARENECARIARELHDNLNQRMALISVELEQLAQNHNNKDDVFKRRVQNIIGNAREVSREIHQMSYDLHPSKLVHLGLVAALRSLCDELGESHGVQIGFENESVPNSLPQDTSLCLYRIAQESLNNVIRHSGSKSAEVELRGGGNEIRLLVSDSGIGFDTESPRLRKGLGLVGMRERLRLVGGTISIESRLSQGTKVDARVPLPQIGLSNDTLAPDDKTRAAEG
jgi:PAS domain S-box-containing protein